MHKDRTAVENALASSDWEGAAVGLRKLIAQRPRDAALLSQLSYVESYRGGFRAARDAALQAAKYAPATLDVARDVVARLRTFNEAEELTAYLKRLGPIERLPIPLLLAAASSLSSLNEQGRALAMLDEAKRGDPEFPATLIARGHVLMYLGRFDEAQAELRRALGRAPQIAQLYWLLSQVSKARPDDNRVARIRGLLDSPRSPADAALLGFALHRELDDLGEHAAAWQALERACKAKRSTVQYRSEDSKALIDALTTLQMPEPEAWQATEGRMPVFIVGMHRSGTTLLEQLLDAHPSVLGVGELYDFTSAMRDATDHHCQGVIDRVIVERAAAVDFPSIGRKYLHGIGWRLGKEACFTDKLPSNFLNAGFICRALPQAKILHMVRDPVETCFSNLRELFSSANPYSYDQSELADYFLQYRRLMAHWHAKFPGRILDVDYARLTSDPEATMREVASFCGLDYVDGMRSTASSGRAIATASAVQAREEVVKLERPKWSPYAAWLHPLMETLRAGGAAASHGAGLVRGE